MMERKTWNPHFARSIVEVFELTRNIETSNEDPTMICILHIYTSMGIYRCEVFQCYREVFEVSTIKNQAQQTLFQYVDTQGVL